MKLEHGRLCMVYLKAEFSAHRFPRLKSHFELST